MRAESPKARALFAIPVAAVAVLAVVWIRSRVPVNGMQAVVAASAALDYRPSLARLSGAFPYRDVRPPQRGSDGADTSAASARLWELISKLHDDNGSRHALGVSFLLVGRAKDAAPALEEALRSETTQHGDLAAAIRRSHDAALLDDLAATYLALNDAARQPLALEAAQRAWSLERTPAIAWTRAVIIDSYHIRERSISAWRDYLALEPRSEWSGYAHGRLNDLLKPTDAELWPAERDRLLAASNDDPALYHDVDIFRQQVRLWCEEELLPKWGDAVLRGYPTAPALLEKIRVLAGALQKASGEREMADAVEAIIRAKGETLRQLAKGHMAYGAAMAADKRSAAQEASAEIASAAGALDPRTTPFGWRARMEHAGMLYSSNQYRQALVELQQLEKECGGHLSMTATARLQSLLATAFMQVSSYKEAADCYVRAIDAYGKIGEKDYESALLIRLADALDLMGDTAGARRYVEQGLEIQEKTGDSKHAHYALIVAAFHAMEADQQAQASLFFDALVDIDTASGNVSRACTSAMWRSAYRYRAGLPDAAASDLAVAQRTCASIPDRSVRERQHAYLAVAEALGSRSTQELLGGLDDAIRYFELNDNHIWLSTAYYARGRRLATRGEPAAAERDFQAALREMDANREKIDQSQLRVSFTATADEITDGYVDFLLQQNRPRDAFEVSDGRRVRELVDSPAARWRSNGSTGSLADIQQALPSGTALVEYRVLSDRVIAWVVTPDHFEKFSLRSQLSEIIAAVADVRSHASFLYDALMKPLGPDVAAAKALVIVADDELERIPFSALSDDRGRSLLEAHATVIAPSGMLFVQSRARWLERSPRDERVLVVEATSGDEGVPALPEAAEEAASIARLHRGARILDGGTLSKESLFNELKKTTMLQFAGHTVIDADPESRALRLGASPSARLSPADIAAAVMPNMRLAYLSACETDSGPVLKSEGSITIARSFFAAGVPLVIGTLWPIDDGAAYLAARTFHERLARGDTPAESVRQAQLALLNHGNPFRDWASLRLVGAGF